MGAPGQLDPGTALWFSVGSLIFFDAVLLVFLYQRNVFPVKGRLIGLCGAALLGTQLQLAVTSAMRLYSVDCKWRWVATFVLLCAALLSYVFRSLVLFYRFELTEETLMYRSRVAKRRRTTVASGMASQSQARLAKVELPSDETWFFRHRHMLRPRFVGALYFASLFMWLAVMLYTLAFRSGDDFCAHGGWPFGVYTVMWVTNALVLGLVALGLRNVVEGFYVKSELLITAVCGLVAFVTQSVADPDSAAYFFLGGWIPFFVVALAVVVFPTYISCRRRGPAGILDEDDEATAARTQLESADTSSLGGLLAFREGREAFTAFLQREFSVENILFWKAVELYRARTERLLQEEASRPDGDHQPGSAHPVLGRSASGNHREGSLKGAALQRQTSGRGSIMAPDFEDEYAGGPYTVREQRVHAQEIFDTHVSPDAPAQVNLPAALIEELSEALQTRVRSGVAMTPFSPDLFDKAQAEIFKLMKTDPFPRFKTDGLYDALVVEIQQAGESAAAREAAREKIEMVTEVEHAVAATDRIRGVSIELDDRYDAGSVTRPPGEG